MERILCEEEQPMQPSKQTRSLVNDIITLRKHLHHRYQEQQQLLWYQRQLVETACSLQKTLGEVHRRTERDVASIGRDREHPERPH